MVDLDEFSANLIAQEDSFFHMMMEYHNMNQQKLSEKLSKEYKRVAK